ncbi:hypothetical protein Tco_0013304 [Tanacetum coccineum]
MSPPMMINDDDDTDDEDEEPTEDEEEEDRIALADSSAIPVVDLVPSAGDTKAFKTDESAPTPRSPQTRVLLGHRAAMIRMRDDIPGEDMPPRRRFVLIAPPPGCDVAESSAAAARPLREVNLRSYQAQCSTRQESEDLYTQLHEARTDRRDIRFKIDVVRGQMTAYETEFHEVRQAYLSSKARNRALLARLETLATHMSRMEWKRQRAEDDAVRQMMHTHVLCNIPYFQVIYNTI